MTIERLSYVYDADGSLVGELRYYFSSLFGRAHCGLCDVTHTRVGRRAAHTACAERIGVPITYYHRDDVPADVADAAGGRWPAVVGHDSAGAAHLLLDCDAIESCNGNVETFEALLTNAMLRA
jgi:hypothetical protein